MQHRSLQPSISTTPNTSSLVGSIWSVNSPGHDRYRLSSATQHDNERLPAHVDVPSPAPASLTMERACPLGHHSSPQGVRKSRRRKNARHLSREEEVTYSFARAASRCHTDKTQHIEAPAVRHEPHILYRLREPVLIIAVAYHENAGRQRKSQML